MFQADFKIWSITCTLIVSALWASWLTPTIAASLGPSTVPLFATIHRLEDQKSLKQALLVCDRLINTHPVLAEGYVQRASLLERLEHPLEARKNYEKVIALFPIRLDDFGNKAIAYSRLGDYNSGIFSATLQLLLTNDAPTRCVRSHAYCQSGDYPRAIDDANKALSRGYTPALLARGEVLLMSGETDMAIEDLSRFINEYKSFLSRGDYSDAYKLRAVAYARRSQHELSELDLKHYRDYRVDRPTPIQQL